VNLAPHESKVVVFTLGAAEDSKEDASELIHRYTSPEKSARALKDANDFWSRFIDTERVETPDEALNLMTNYWLKYQSISCRLWGKSGAYQVSAGIGFRDQLQDSQIFLVSEPELTKSSCSCMLHTSSSKGMFITGGFPSVMVVRAPIAQTICSGCLSSWMPT